jgi:hypothetical protein
MPSGEGIMLHHGCIAVLCCSLMAVAGACTMSNTRPEQLVAPDASVAAPHQESDGKSEPDGTGTGGAASPAPGADASAISGSGGKTSAPPPVKDAGPTPMTMMMPPPIVQPSERDAGMPDALDASSDAVAQPLPDCAANFAVEVTACLLLDPTNPECPHLADHCGLIDASVDPAGNADAG